MNQFFSSAPAMQERKAKMSMTFQVSFWAVEKEHSHGGKGSEKPGTQGHRVRTIYRRAFDPSIANQVLLLVVRNDPNLDTVLQTMNAIMFPIFLGDFLYRFFTHAEHRSVTSSAASAGPICSPVSPFPK